MTTQVRITITQPHNPVRISSVTPDGRKVPLMGLAALEDSGLFYVHSMQSLVVEEVNAEKEGTDGSGD
jgi:hypothetical protein